MSTCQVNSSADILIESIELMLFDPKLKSTWKSKKMITFFHEFRLIQENHYYFAKTLGNDLHLKRLIELESAIVLIKLI